MRGMDLRRYDLNLLVTLEALLDEGSVTAAARRLHLSQSAVSAALDRLRTVFTDPLLVRVGNRMQATPFAKRLQGPIKTALASVSRGSTGPSSGRRQGSPSTCCRVRRTTRSRACWPGPSTSRSW
jgi:DNA-binding transcriptional LysR family regulator